jgi:hypothetical protein
MESEARGMIQDLDRWIAGWLEPRLRWPWPAIDPFDDFHLGGCAGWLIGIATVFVVLAINRWLQSP